jgi:hypothetical protein
MARQIRWRGILSPDVAGDGRSPDPVAWRPGPKGSPVVPPKSVVDAVRLMQFGAILNVLEVVRGLLTRGQLHDAVAAEARRQSLDATAADLDRVASFSLTLTTTVAVLSAVLWFVMSRATERGSRWGRIIASVLFALAVGGFFGGLLPTAGLFSQVFALAMLLVGAYALVRLWHRDSSAWIRYQSTPQD